MEISRNRFVCKTIKSHTYLKDDLNYMKTKFKASGESNSNPSEQSINAWQKFLLNVAKTAYGYYPDIYTKFKTPSSFLPKNKRIGLARLMIENMK